MILKHPHYLISFDPFLRTYPQHFPNNSYQASAVLPLQIIQPFSYLFLINNFIVVNLFAFF